MKLVRKKLLLQTIPFNVEELDFIDKGDIPTHPYYRISCYDWVNILAVNDQNEALLVKQYRAGALKFVRELPGGVINEDEQANPILAAKRELEEETGFIADHWQHLLSINPNPAIQHNKVHFFLAKGCKINENRKHFPDPTEDIEIEWVLLNELPELVKKGEIDHALSALCIFSSGLF